MIPVAAAMMGAGLVMGAMGSVKADFAQARSEMQNAAFYREQANLARISGERQRLIFDRESVILFGEQRTAFAKAGVDSSSNSLFLAQQAFYRVQEGEAITIEKEFNVRLANLRADQSEATANSLRDNAGLKAAGGMLGGMGSMASVL